MCFVHLQRASDKEMAAPDVTGDVLSVWRAMLASVDWNGTRIMAQSDAVCRLNNTKARSTKKL